MVTISPILLATAFLAAAAERGAGVQLSTFPQVYPTSSLGSPWVQVEILPPPHSVSEPVYTTSPHLVEVLETVASGASYAARGAPLPLVSTLPRPMVFPRAGLRWGMGIC